MAKSYEELMGSIGRAMFFRPERKKVRDLLSRDANPVLRVGKREHALFDISMNGLSFFAETPHDVMVPGDELEVTLLLHGQPVYTGKARVARTEPGRGATRVALALLGGFIDLPELTRKDEQGRLNRQLGEGPSTQWKSVPRAYLDVLGEAVHFVQYYRHSLDRHEASLRAGGRELAPQLADLAVRAADAARGRWTGIERAASQVVAACMEEPQAMRAVKDITEVMLTPLLLDSPMISRSYLKPLGYPGDYQVMLYYYENAFVGPSVFAQVFHKFFIEHPLSHGVRTRKDMVVDFMHHELERLQAAGNPEPTLRVASLGCGPAREVSDFVSGRRKWPGKIKWTLIDQEDETLSVAYHAGTRELAANGNSSRGELHCLNLSFSQLLQEPALMQSIEPQDFIYSTGLFDYLREARARALVVGLYERLAPGGLLAIGNAVGPNQWFWSPECVLDWTLLYRTREEMLRLAADLPPGHEVEVVKEPAGAYYFLLVRKPRQGT